MKDPCNFANYQRLLEIIYKLGVGFQDFVPEKTLKYEDANGLLFKFYGHCKTLEQIVGAHIIDENNKNYLDVASINVIARSALESFLVFSEVYVHPESTEDAYFMYKVWDLGGYIDRAKYPAMSEKGKERLINEKTIIDNLKQEIMVNPIFTSLDKDRQKAILAGKWRSKSWSKIGLKAGLNEKHAIHLYSYLCGFSHSSRLCITQITQAFNPEKQKAIWQGVIQFVFITMAFFIKSVTNILPNSKTILDNDSMKLINFFIELEEEVGKITTIEENSFENKFD